jgi:hypothetical protein
MTVLAKPSSNYLMDQSKRTLFSHPVDWKHKFDFKAMQTGFSLCSEMFTRLLANTEAKEGVYYKSDRLMAQLLGMISLFSDRW